MSCFPTMGHIQITSHNSSSLEANNVIMSVCCPSSGCTTIKRTCYVVIKHGCKLLQSACLCNVCVNLYVFELHEFILLSRLLTSCSPTCFCPRTVQSVNYSIPNGWNIVLSVSICLVCRHAYFRKHDQVICVI